MSTDGKVLPDRLPDWDPATDLHLFREMRISPKEILDACDLGRDCRLEMVPLVRSDLTGLRVLGDRHAVDVGSETDRGLISVHVRGEALGGTVAVVSTLVCQSPGEGGPLRPQRTGSELWSDEIRCVLEGGAARFPVSAVAFSSLPTLDPDAAWTLDWDTSRLEAPMLGAVRLLINTENERMRDSVISNSAEPGSDVVRAQVRLDVARTLIVNVLSDETFLASADSYPELSVGRTIRDLLHLHWDESPEAIAARMKNFPQRFAMELQARFPPVPPAE